MKTKLPVIILITLALFASACSNGTTDVDEPIGINYLVVKGIDTAGDAIEVSFFRLSSGTKSSSGSTEITAFATDDIYVITKKGIEISRGTITQTLRPTITDLTFKPGEAAAFQGTWDGKVIRFTSPDAPVSGFTQSSAHNPSYSAQAQGSRRPAAAVTTMAGTTAETTTVVTRTTTVGITTAPLPLPTVYR